MSNKPKGVKRLVTYYPTKGERCHMAMVREAKKQGLKHPGSRPIHILSNIVPAKYSNILIGLKRLFSK